jgi:hypothetical protein
LTASWIARAYGLLATLSQTLKKSQPPSTRTRRASRSAAGLSGGNVSPNWKLERGAVGLLPRDPAHVGKLGLGVIEHRLVEVGGAQEDGRREAGSKLTGEDAGAAGRLQHAAAGDALSHPPGEVVGVRLEHDRPHAPVVQLGDGAGEAAAGVCHGTPPFWLMVSTQGGRYEVFWERVPG